MMLNVEASGVIHSHDLDLAVGELSGFLVALANPAWLIKLSDKVHGSNACVGLLEFELHPAASVAATASTDVATAVFVPQDRAMPTLSP